jgi:hypothetical protein
MLKKGSMVINLKSHLDKRHLDERHFALNGTVAKNKVHSHTNFNKSTEF